MQRELPEGWEWRKLKSICEIRKGSSITKKDITEGNVPVIAGGRSPAYFHNEANRNGETITVSASGAYAGFVNYFSIPIFASDCTTLKSIYTNLLLPKFLFLYLKSRQQILYQFQRGGGQPHVYPKDLQNLKTPLPPLKTQHKIVSVLEKAEETKRLRAQADELTQKLIQSVFLEMFGDLLENPYGFKLGTIGDLVIKTQYGTSKKSNENRIGIPILRMNNITYEGNWDLSSLKHIELDSKDEKKYLVHKGELLFNRTNSKELVGKSAVYKEDKPMAFAGYLIKLVTDSPATSEYIAAHLNSQYGKVYLSKLAKSIVGMANINAKEVQNIPILLPPIELRKKYSKIVRQINSNKQLQQQSSQEMDTLFDALMQKAFTGKL